MYFPKVFEHIDREYSHPVIGSIGLEKFMRYSEKRFDIYDYSYMFDPL